MAWSRNNYFLHSTVSINLVLSDVVRTGCNYSCAFFLQTSGCISCPCSSPKRVLFIPYFWGIKPDSFKISSRRLIHWRFLSCVCHGSLCFLESDAKQWKWKQFTQHFGRLHQVLYEGDLYSRLNRRSLQISSARAHLGLGTFSSLTVQFICGYGQRGNYLQFVFLCSLFFSFTCRQ